MALPFASASSSGSSLSLPGRKCDSSLQVGSELPHRINGTYICGVNPFIDRSVLEKCCAGAITNITEPAPTSGPYSDSWPVTCLAYCPIRLEPKFDGVTDEKALKDFANCVKKSDAVRSWVCTEVDRPAPNECVQPGLSVGCTDRFSHSTWDGSSFLSGSLSTPLPSQATGDSAMQSSMAPSITGAKESSGTAAPSSMHKNAGQRIGPVALLKIVAITIAIHAICFTVTG